MDKLEISSEKELKEWLSSKEKPKIDWRIGTEHEKFIFSLDSHKPIPYFGDQGIKKLLINLKKQTSWVPIEENKNIIGLKAKDGSSISLEPGGQLELSGAPLKNLHMTCDETGKHLNEMKKALKPLGLGMAGFGFHPSAEIDECYFMPKGRYKIMREWMPKVGSMGVDMMLRTCTIQVNLDYSDETDMVRKFKNSLKIQPIITALFANSPFRNGSLSGFVSMRTEVWRNTDKVRCGIPECVFEEDFGYSSWINYLLDIPMYFLYRNGEYFDVAGQSFRSFLKGNLKGFEGQRPTIKDFEDHLTIAFPDVRLKGYLEMRGADGGPWNRICALPAIWVGLLYDSASMDAIEKLTKEFTIEDVINATFSAARFGLSGYFKNYKIKDLASEILNISFNGLKNRNQLDSSGEDETGFLSPLFKMTETGNTLADDMIKKYHSSWGKSVNPSFEEQSIYNTSV